MAEAEAGEELVVHALAVAAAWLGRLGATEPRLPSSLAAADPGAGEEVRVELAHRMPGLYTEQLQAEEVAGRRQLPVVVSGRMAEATRRCCC
jgi:hypothetical protein